MNIRNTKTKKRKWRHRKKADPTMRESQVIEAIQRAQDRLGVMTRQAVIMEGQSQEIARRLDQEHAKFLAIVVEELGFKPEDVLKNLDAQKPEILVP